MDKNKAGLVRGAMIEVVRLAGILRESPRNPAGACAAFLRLPLWLRVWFFVDLAFWFSLLVGIAVWAAM